MIQIFKKIGQDFVDIEVFEETSKIMDSLKHRECKEALEWCKTHQTKLQKTNVNLTMVKVVIESIRIQIESSGICGIDQIKSAC